MIKVIQRLGGANRTFIVKDPVKMHFWTTLANRSKWVQGKIHIKNMKKVKHNYFGIKIKEMTINRQEVN